MREKKQGFVFFNFSILVVAIMHLITIIKNYMFDFPNRRQELQTSLLVIIPNFVTGLSYLTSCGRE